MFKGEGYHVYHVYIITNRNKTVLYTGMTNFLARRLDEHAENIKRSKKTFAARYRCKHLLYYQKFTWVHDAISREKEIKGWRREKKKALIKTNTPKSSYPD
ncbi:MAG: GIY-YIG nuclease family protein [Bacteroidota bacterium]